MDVKKDCPSHNLFSNFLIHLKWFSLPILRVKFGCEPANIRY